MYLCWLRFIKGPDRWIGRRGVLVEQDGEVRVASVRNELAGDVGNVIPGFLSASRGYDLSGIPACWTRDEIDGALAGLGSPNLTMGRTTSGGLGRPNRTIGDCRSGLRERTTSSTWVCTDGRVGSRQGGTSTLFVGR